MIPIKHKLLFKLQAKKALWMVSFFFVVTVGAAHADDFGQRIDRFLQTKAKDGFSGAYALVEKGKVISSKTYGFADRERKLPMTLDAVYDIGSLTKQFTAVAILQLVENNKVGLQDPLKRFFPGIPQDKASITLHQLLTHSSGISEYTGNDYHYIDKEEFLEEVFDRELSNSPGEKFEYSNVGYSLLGIIIEGVTGQDYEVYLREHIFGPTGMKATGYLKADWSDSTITKGYQGRLLWGTSVERWNDDGGVSWHLKANGGLLSTLNDLVRWYEALFAHQLLSEHYTELAFAKHVPVKSGMHYGYGWRHFESKKDNTLHFHGGTNTIFFNIAMLFHGEPDRLLLFMNNAANKKVFSMPRAFIQMAFDPSFQP